MYYETTCRFPVGTITLASDGTALAGLWLENQKYFGGTLNGEMAQKDDLPIFEKTVNWLERYFSGQNPAIGELPLGSRRQTVPSGGLEASLRYSLWRDNHLRRDCQKDGCQT